MIRSRSPQSPPSHLAIENARVTEGHRPLDVKTTSAIVATAGAALGLDDVLAMTFLLAVSAGWAAEQVSSMCSGMSTGDKKLDALLDVIVTVAAGTGKLDPFVLDEALKEGWTVDELTESFSYIALVLYAAYFADASDTYLNFPAEVQ